MQNNCIKNLLNLKGVVVKNIKNLKDLVEVYIEFPVVEQVCPHCNTKFDNIDGGMNGWDMSSIRNRISNSKKVEITNKLDGSNQNYRWYRGEVVGSGSQALDIKESWRLKRGYQLLNKNYVGKFTNASMNLLKNF